MEPERLAFLFDRTFEQRWRNVSFGGILLWTWLQSKSVACEVIDDRLNFYAYACDGATLSWFARYAGCTMQAAQETLKELESSGTLETRSDEHRGDHYAVSAGLYHLSSDVIEELYALGRIEFKDMFNKESRQ